METRDFLHAILPRSGRWWFAAWLDAATGQWRHRAHDDVDEMAATLLAVSRRGEPAYMALASYEHAKYQGPDGKWRRRTKDNAQFARCAWLDIDCGPAKPYATKKDGAAALVAFVKGADLPQPTYVVDSGNGLHVYWVFDRDVPKLIWERAAGRLHALCRADLFNADSHLTGNIAAVLRPIGTLNSKDLENPKPVRLLRERDTVGFAPWLRAVNAALKDRGVTPKSPSKPSAPKGAGQNSAFADGVEPLPPIDAEKMAGRCAIFGAMRDDGGATQPEPVWFPAICTLIHSSGGDELIHTWSSQHTSYSYDECQSKIEHARSNGYKPARCDTFRGLSDLCNTCKEQCNSPASLGFPDPVHVPETVEADSGEPDAVEVLELPDCISEEKYRWTGKALMAKIAKADGTESWVPCCNQYPSVAFLWKDDESKEFSVRVKAWSRINGWSQGDIGLGSLGQGGAALARDLAQKAGILSASGNTKPLEEFMRTWIVDVQSKTNLQSLRQAMGWQPDGSFLLGNSLYRPDGGVETCVVSRALQGAVDAIQHKGDLDKYIDTVDHLFNRPDRTLYQFSWLAGFASILPALVHPSPVGLILALVGSQSGRGKTTIAQAGLGVWGNPFANAQYATGKNATELGITTMAGQRKHLPVLVDEVTEWSGEKISQFAYHYANGVAKIQAKSEGGLRDNSKLNWANLMYLTGNKSIVDLLSAYTKNPGPQIARVFEVRLDDVKLDTADAARVKELLGTYHGLGGDVFLRKIVPKQDLVRTLIEREQERITKALKLGSAERYWILTAASVLVAFKLTQKFGLHSFDEDRFRHWTLKRVRDMSRRALEAYRDPEDVFNDFLMSISPGIIVTTSDGKDRETVAIGGVPRTAITGRIVASQNNPKMYVPVSRVKHWCAEAGVDYGTLRKELMLRGLVYSTNVRFNVMQGLPGAAIRGRCWSINYSQCKSSGLTVVESSGDIAKS
jgi:hypothetical protein